MAIWKPFPGESNENAKVIRSIYMISTWAIALTWLYHGIVPKLLFMEMGERRLIEISGLFKGNETLIVYSVGVGQVLLGLAFIFFGGIKKLHYLSILVSLFLCLGALVIKPEMYTYPFNPATASFGILALSLIVIKIINHSKSNNENA